MFTGIVHGTGTLTAVRRLDAGSRLSVAHSDLSLELGPGSSVSVDGVCLTAIDPTDTGFEADVSLETLRRTTLGARSVGDAVNLEPALRLQDSLGGHLVQGHVDATGRLLERRPEGNSEVLRLSVPEGVGQHCVEKGSIAINGVSLTLSSLSSDWIEVTIIPHTLEVTTLSRLRIGEDANLEADLVSKYVEKHVERSLSLAPARRDD